MREWQNLSHVKWCCRYHIVLVPKYRKKAIFGQLCKGIGRILRELCEQEVGLQSLSLPSRCFSTFPNPAHSMSAAPRPCCDRLEGIG